MLQWDNGYPHSLLREIDISRILVLTHHIGQISSRRVLRGTLQSYAAIAQCVRRTTPSRPAHRGHREALPSHRGPVHRLPLKTWLPEADRRLLAASQAQVHAFLKEATRGRRAAPSPAHVEPEARRHPHAVWLSLKPKLIEDDPTEGLRPVRVSSQGRVPLTLSEFVALLLAMSEEAEPFRSRNLALAQLGFHCGWRVQELHRLDLDHLDCLNRRIVNLMVKGRSSSP